MTKLQLDDGPCSLASFPPFDKVSMRVYSGANLLSEVEPTNDFQSLHLAVHQLWESCKLSTLDTERAYEQIEFFVLSLDIKKIPPPPKRSLIRRFLSWFLRDQEVEQR